MYDWDDIDEFFDDDFAPLNATFASREIAAIRYSSETEAETFSAGSDDTVDFKLMIKVSDFEGYDSPKPDDLIEYDEVEYRISTVETDSNSKVFILTLKEKYA